MSAKNQFDIKARFRYRRIVVAVYFSLHLWAAAEADTQFAIFHLSALKKQCLHFLKLPQSC